MVGDIGGNCWVFLGFIPPEELFLSQYISNVDHLYIDKKCQGLLTTAREMMKKDLHDSFKYEPEVGTNYGFDLYIL